MGIFRQLHVHSALTFGKQIFTYMWTQLVIHVHREYQ